jgi:Outer membrane lipoprotein-sorting protein
VSKQYDDGQTEKSLVRFIEPADVKGTGLLTYDYEKKDDDIWFYLPAQKKTRRIVSSEKAKSFMGSEFSYADMTPPAVEDFNHKLAGEENVEGVDCWIIESTPKNEEIEEENGYSRRVAHIGKTDYVVRKATFYDLDSELHKELSIKSVKEVDPDKKRYRPTHMIMINKQDGRKSEVVVEAIQLRKDIPDDYFTERYLERE